MNLTNLVDEFSFWKDLNISTSDPLILIFLIGITAIITLLLLLKLAFISMGKADEAANKVSDEKQN